MVLGALGKTPLKKKAWTNHPLSHAANDTHGLPTPTAPPAPPAPCCVARRGTFSSHRGTFSSEEIEARSPSGARNGGDAVFSSCFSLTFVFLAKGELFWLTVCKKSEFLKHWRRPEIFLANLCCSMKPTIFQSILRITSRGSSSISQSAGHTQLSAKSFPHFHLAWAQSVSTSQES